MRAPIVTIMQDGEPTHHMGAKYGAYATICGMDGADPGIGQETVTTPRGAKINCEDCRLTWEMCREFRASRFAEKS